MRLPSLYFLGPPKISRDGEPVELTSVKGVALLAYLALTRRPQRRERLLDLLWPDSLSDAARKNLRNTLWMIRKALGEEALQSDNDQLTLAPELWVDVQQFERVVEPTAQPPDSLLDPAHRDTIALYRGPLLEGLSLPDAPDFELWLTTERERLGQMHLRALERLIALYEEAGEWQEVITLGRQALAHDNLQEPMHRALMEAHARLGERPEALRQYEMLREILAQELGVEPLPDTEALRAAILSGELQPTSPARPPTRPAPVSRRPPIMGGPLRAPFVGRQRECELLDEEFRLAATGQSRVVLLIGEVGIGKSRLWQEWAATLPPRQVVLESRAIEATQGLPFAPLMELLRSQDCTRSLFSAESSLSPVWLAEIARLLPELRERVPGLPMPPSLPPEEERHRLFEAFARSLQAIEARPLVLFIDDLHWADRSTIEWLEYLVHRMREAPFLLVGTYRPEDAPASLAHLIAGWGRAGVVQRIELGRLSEEESVELLTALGGDPVLASRLQSRSAGNPYFLVELSQAGPGDLPPALGELICARINRLPDTARQVVQAAAVLGSEFDFGLLRRTSGRGEEEALDALDALLDAAVLVERGSHYTFAHPLVAEVVRQELSGARRSFLHRRAAQALESAYPDRLAQIAGTLAQHYEQGGEPLVAARYAELAARRALELAAPIEAIDFYRQALVLDPTPARQFGLGQALFRASEVKEARRVIEATVEAFERAGERRGAAEACLELAYSYLSASNVDAVVRWAEKSLGFIDFEQDHHAHALAHFLLGAVRLMTEPSLTEAEQQLAESMRLAIEHDLTGIAASCYFELGNLRAHRDDLPAAIQTFQESISLARKVGNQFQEVLGHNNMAYYSILQGDLVRARTYIEKALELAEMWALEMPCQYLHSTRGELALAERQWDEAERWFERGLAVARRYDNPVQVVNYRANLALVAQGRGALDDALVGLEAAREAIASLPAPHLQVQIELWLAELHLARGERMAAEESVAHADRRLAGSERQRLRGWADRVRHQLQQN